MTNDLKAMFGVMFAILVVTGITLGIIYFVGVY